MNTIKNYLDNMFLGLPQTEDVTRAKMELLAMMEDKYYELKESGKTENEAVGIVISEFGNLDELGETLGIKQAIENKSDILQITYDKAINYIEDSKEIAPKTALGVFLLIISPAMLLFLMGLSELNLLDVKEGLLIAVGLITLIGLIAIGVFHLMRYTSKIEKDKLKSIIFEIDYKTEQMIRSMLNENESTYKSAVSISVIAYILSALPLIITPLIFEHLDGLSVMSVVVTLTIIALSTYNIISKGGINDACNVLLQEGDYSIKNKTNKTLKTVTSVYWCVVVAIYLAYSFITANWHISWIVWPIAGVLFGAIKAIAENR